MPKKRKPNRIDQKQRGDTEVDEELYRYTG